MDIRPLTSDDATEYQGLRLRALQEYPKSFSSSFEEESQLTDQQVESRLLMAEGRMVLGAFDKRSLVGTIGIGRSRGIKTQHKCFIWGMYVNPDYHSRGIGKLLLKNSIEYVRTVPGVEQLYLSVIEGNKPALTLYKSSGFIEYGCEPNALVVDGMGYSEILMAFKL